MTAATPELEPIILKHKIDPLIDCVFKALFGEEENKALLIDFLNSILRPTVPVVDVTLINTAHEVPQLDGKLTTVDIKAQDRAGAIFHVEVQLALSASRNERKLFYWATMYSRQLSEGQKYQRLQPVTSIWVFRKPIWRDSYHHHRFQVWDRQADLRLSDHLAIHTIELEKWRPPQGEASGEDHWLHFLRDARDWDSLPEPLLHQPQMRQAMSTLKKFSDDDIAFYRYFSRLDAERVHGELVEDAANAKQEAQAAKQRADAAVAHMEQEVRAAQQQAEAAQQQAEAAQQQAEAAQQQAEVAQQQAQEAHANALRDSLRLLYEARFGPLPADLAAVIAVASSQTLAAYLPRFVNDPADALRALCLSAADAPSEPSP